MSIHRWAWGRGRGRRRGAPPPLEFKQIGSPLKIRVSNPPLKKTRAHVWSNYQLFYKNEAFTAFNLVHFDICQLHVRLYEFKLFLTWCSKLALSIIHKPIAFQRSLIMPVYATNTHLVLPPCCWWVAGGSPHSQSNFHRDVFEWHKYFCYILNKHQYCRQTVHFEH